MTWENPISFDGSVSTLALWNTYLKDNMDALKAPPTDSYNGIDAATYTLGLTSTSWSDISSVFELNISSKGGDLLVIFNADLQTTTSILYLDIEVNGNRQGGTDGILAILDGIGVPKNLPMYWLLTEMQAGDYTIKMKYKMQTAATSAILFMGGQSGDSAIAPQFVVREVS